MALTLQEILDAAARGERVAILYHFPCPDGFLAAYCAWTRLGERADFIPYGHDDEPDPARLGGAYVAMCDCCYKRPALLKAAAMAKRMLVLDHHESSKDACGDLEFCQFDLERSGGGMAWDFFRPGEARPLLVDAVEDRDLTRLELPDTEVFCAKLDTLPWDFQAWDKAAKLSGDALARFLREGAEMLAQFESQAQAIAETATPCLFMGRRAYLLNAPYRFASRCGAILCARPGCEMAACWSSADLRHARLSLRSKRGSDCDVKALAVELGGGGHPCASGATVGIARLAELAAPVDWTLLP